MTGARPVVLTACLALTALIAASLAGCVNQAREVAQYQKVIGRAQQPVTFRPGDPLSLEKALALANEYNESLGLQGEDYLQSIIARDRAAGAFMPTVNLVPSYIASEKSSFVSSRTDTTDVPLQGRMNVFNGFSDLANYRAAGLSIEQRRALLLDAQASLLISVTQSYYQVLRSEASVVVLQNSLAVQEERLRDTRARQKAGLARSLDVAQTEAQAAATRVLLISARNDVVNGRSLLAFLIGTPVGDSKLADQTPIRQVTESLSQLEDRAMQSRQDIIAARYAIAAAKQAVNAALGQYLPSVTVNLNYYLSRQSNPSDSQWAALFQANIPIFSANQIHANVRQAWSQLRQTVLAESQTRRTILLNVQTATENLASSHQRLTQLHVQVAAAGDALRQSEQSYRVGLATNLDRLTAQDALLSAQLQLTSEEFNQKVFYLNLLRAIGALTMRLPGEPATNPATQPSTQPATP